MSEKSIVIIGAGVAGLTAGIYAQMNGYKTQIFEKHFKPGGLCTAWDRKGYVIDGCLHWLVGSSPKASYHHMWQEVGALQSKQIINMDQFMQIETSGGKVVTLFTRPSSLDYDGSAPIASAPQASGRLIPRKDMAIRCSATVAQSPFICASSR